MMDLNEYEKTCVVSKPTLQYRCKFILELKKNNNNTCNVKQVSMKSGVDWEIITYRYSVILLLPVLWIPLLKPIASVTTLTLPPKPLQDCTASNKENQHILKLNLPSSQSKLTQVISSSDTHNNQPLSEKQPIRNIDTIQQRDRNILEFGYMPLVPHTRRNWDRDEVLKLEGTTISWPPHGWKKMSSDQRKLAWEFAATAIELKTVSFNVINRTDLLDQYNYLALPGTSEDDKHSDNNIRSKVRYYNYEFLRIVANKKTTSREDNEFVEVLERAASVRNKFVDFLVHQIKR